MIAEPSLRKSKGIHYTPARLASLVADRLVHRANLTPDEPIRILDPACGDGALLDAFRESLRQTWYGPVTVVGVETDSLAARAAERRLAGWKDADLCILNADFLSICAQEGGQGKFWEPEQPNPAFFRSFDLAIANPPYVRTQVLGAQAAQRLADRFGLRGRVDLYHAFWIAMTQAIRTGGTLGIITSNRFLSTLGGASLRRFLIKNYEIEEVIDLGDSKLFEAAVLPAVFIGRRFDRPTREPNGRIGNFFRLYTCANPTCDSCGPESPLKDVYELLRRGEPGRHRTPEGWFEPARGTLGAESRAGGVWTLNTSVEGHWLDRVRGSAHGVFDDIAQIRVGVKTTADEVFIRSDWDSLPEDQRPEDELLHPLLSHENARRWWPRTLLHKDSKVLYPHEIVNGVRQPINLRAYPRASAYLETFRDRLTRRKYVIGAGREWYEIWVPQSPDAWRQPKVVFPDISPEPRFYLDTKSRIVDGDSYWLTLRPGVPEDFLYVLMALANSKVIARFHDLAFNNRLYSGRRRYITQYVSRYPWPELSPSLTMEIVDCAKLATRAQAVETDWSKMDKHQTDLERLVAQAFRVEDPV